MSTASREPNPEFENVLVKRLVPFQFNADGSLKPFHWQSPFQDFLAELRQLPPSHERLFLTAWLHCVIDAAALFGLMRVLVAGELLTMFPQPQTLTLLIRLANPQPFAQASLRLMGQSDEIRHRIVNERLARSDTPSPKTAADFLASTAWSGASYGVTLLVTDLSTRTDEAKIIEELCIRHDPFMRKHNGQGVCEVLLLSR